MKVVCSMKACVIWTLRWLARARGFEEGELTPEANPLRVAVRSAHYSIPALFCPLERALEWWPRRLLALRAIHQRKVTTMYRHSRGQLVHLLHHQHHWHPSLA